MSVRKDNHRLILPDNVYSVLKFAALWVFPELMTIYSLGAVLFDWPNAQFISAIIASIASVTGGLAGLSTHNYRAIKTKVIDEELLLIEKESIQ